MATSSERFAIAAALLRAMYKLVGGVFWMLPLQFNA